MTPAQPLIPFLLQLAAFERGSAGRSEPAKASCEVLPIGLAETEGNDRPDGHDVHNDQATHDAGDADDDAVTIARADLRVARAPQLPRAPLFSQRGAVAAGRIPARGSSPDLRRR